MSRVLEEIIKSMQYFSQERNCNDWSKFLEFLTLLGHSAMMFPPDIIEDANEKCDYDFGPLFSALPQNEWSLYLDTRDSLGSRDIMLLWWKNGESHIVEFQFVPQSEVNLRPVVHEIDEYYLQHRIPLIYMSSMTTRFLYLWYFMNRLNMAEVTIGLPLPEVASLFEGFSNAKKFYEGKLQTLMDGRLAYEALQPKKRNIPLRTSNGSKRPKLELEDTPFPEFDADSGYAHFFTPQTLEKYLILLDRLQKLHEGERNVAQCTFIDLLVKVQNAHLFSDDVYLIKKEKNFKSYFPTGSPKLTKLKNLAGFLFELFKDLMEPTSESNPYDCKVIFGDWEQQRSILQQVNETLQGSLIDIVAKELGDKESLWRILQRYLLVRQGTDLTASS